MNNTRLVSVLCALALAGVVLAKDAVLVTEKLGPTYPIVERDAIEMILAKLKGMRDSGEMAKIESQMKEKVEKSVMSPTPVAGITHVSKPNIRYFDPTWVLNADIYDALGNRIAVKGTKVNPLDVKPVKKKMYFFDGRDLAQVALALKLSEQYGSDFLPILTAGDWRSLSNQLQQPVYFDQQGSITQRLTITAVPSLVQQEGKQMKIEELVP